MLKITTIFSLVLTFGVFAQTDSLIIRTPNVFTPNGDGVNDYFGFQTQNSVELECVIFNRYGEIVYYFYGVNGYWDGTVPSDNEASTGVYFYSVTVTDDEFNTYSKTGEIHLFR